MHITPWSWPQLHLYLKLAGFSEIRILPEPMSAAKHWYELLFALPAKLHCQHRVRKATTDEQREFWGIAGSGPALLGRHLIVTCIKP